MRLVQRLKDWREGKKEDREAIAREQALEPRAGDQPQRSQADVVGDTAGQFPPPS